jgi:hypothetical protein
MELGFNSFRLRPGSLRRYLRPAAIWLGLGTFFAGALFLGATLAAPAGSAEIFTGPMLLLLGVSLIGGGFTMDVTDFLLDPKIEFEGRHRIFVAGISLLFLVLSAAVLALSVL